MLKFRSRRSDPSPTAANTQEAPQAVAGKACRSAADPALPIRMQEVIRYEKEYLRRIAREVAQGLILMTGIALLLYGLRLFGQVGGLGSFWAAVRLDVTPQTGLGLLALLTTIVIGLQVTVRGIPESSNSTIALGRQLAIENAARSRTQRVCRIYSGRRLLPTRRLRDRPVSVAVGSGGILSHRRSCR